MSEGHGILQTGGIAFENSAVDLQRRRVCLERRYRNQLFHTGPIGAFPDQMACFDKGIDRIGLRFAVQLSQGSPGEQCCQIHFA
jgi:hypothetical protein